MVATFLRLLLIQSHRKWWLIFGGYFEGHFMI